MKISVIDKAKKKKILSELEPLGVKRVEHLLIKTGLEKIRAYSGSLSIEEIYSLWRTIPIEGIGLYFAREIIDKKSGKREVKLTIDGAHILNDFICNRIVLLGEEDEIRWFFGENIYLSSKTKEEIDFENCFVVVKSLASGDIIGTGKVGFEKEILYNYLPKERRRKKQLL
jgi:NOL1/NOP2/fmu family ribosome biogenesis protein